MTMRFTPLRTGDPEIDLQADELWYDQMLAPSVSPDKHMEFIKETFEMFGVSPQDVTQELTRQGKVELLARIYQNPVALERYLMRRFL